MKTEILNQSRAFCLVLRGGILVFALASLLGCGKSYNSSSTDRSLYGTTNSGGAQFKAAFVVLAKNCIGCHTHSHWASFNEGDFIASGDIISNDPVRSPIYFRLTDNDSGIAGNMPLGGPAMTAEEISAIKNWVLVATP
jgi:mono/diheme cytochrome c family protein